MNKKLTVFLTAALLSTTVVGCANKTTKDTSEDKAKTSKVSKKKPAAKKSSEKPAAKKESKSAQKEMLDSIIESANTQIPAIKKQLASTFSDIQITGEGENTIVYRYTFKDKQPTTVDLPALKPSFTQQAKPVFDATSAYIKDLHVKFIVEQPDKTEIGTIEITQADVDKLPAEK